MSSIRKRPSEDDLKESGAKKEKPDILGPTFGNPCFLNNLQKLYFPEKTLEECAQWIVETSGKNWYSLVEYIYTGFLPDLKENRCLSEIFVILMNTYVMYYLVEHGSTDIICFFNGHEIELKITCSLIENGNPVFLSEIYQLQLVNNGSMIYYEATFRQNLRLREGGIGEVFFEPSDDASHPPVLLGKGSYGFVFMIMGIDGKWYIVKVFSNESSAKHEWSALDIVNGKHPCLQQGIEIQTGRKGDIQHIIVSKFQGKIVLSKIRNTKYQLSLEQIIMMFLDLCDGIHTIHTSGILHCDIKPCNIIFQENPDGTGTLILIDFGITSNIGLKTEDPNSHMSLWYRIPNLFLHDFMKSFNTLITEIVELPILSCIIDWWAFFISFLHVISPPSNDFLGFRSKTEDEIRRNMIQTSCVAQLMLKMKKFLSGDKANMGLVREIYFVLLEEEGPDKFIETFNDFGITQASAAMYDKYLGMFKKLRMTHPMISHVKNVFQGVYCEDASFNLSGPINKLIDLFVEILRDGADLSLLGCLTMENVEDWINQLDDYRRELCGPIFFY